MAKQPPTPFNHCADEATSDAAPSLRLRFDSPPLDEFGEARGSGGAGGAEPAQELDNVISNVEQLSLGIDTMLRRANSSSLGAIATDSGSPVGDAHDGDDDESIDDEPMMAMFDEEAPPHTDIHAIDRMLASQAEAAMNADAATVASSAFEKFGIAVAVEAMAAHDSSAYQPGEEVMLEGDFEDINALISTSTSSFVPPAADMPAPMASSPMMRAAESDLAQLEIRREKAIEQFAATSANALAASRESESDRPQMDDSSPPPPLDLSLAPSQAQGIAAALAAASAGGSGGAGIHPRSFAAHAPAPKPAGPTQSVPPREETSAAVPAMQQVQAANKPASGTTIKEVVARPASRHFASMGSRIVEVVALTNLPLRMVPKSMQHAVNLIAVSLALWAPAVWALGPKIAAARQATHAITTSHEGGHGESASKADEGGHGESKDSHGEKSSSAAKKSSSSSKKASSKKSSAKKQDAAHGGGH